MQIISGDDVGLTIMAREDPRLTESAGVPRYLDDGCQPSNAGHRDRWRCHGQAYSTQYEYSDSEVTDILDSGSCVASGEQRPRLRRRSACEPRYCLLISAETKPGNPGFPPWRAPLSTHRSLTDQVRLRSGCLDPTHLHSKKYRSEQKSKMALSLRDREVRTKYELL